MRAVARITGTIVLLALVSVGFLLAMRVCGPAPAQAGERVCEFNPGLLEPPPRQSVDAIVPADLSPVLHAETADPVFAGGGESRADEIRSAASFEAEDGLEMHNLVVWDSPEGTPMVYVSFTPVSLESFFAGVPFRHATLEGQEVEVADVAPLLDEAHVTARIDGELVGVTAVEWYYAAYGDLGGADVKYMPVCLVRLERPAMRPGTHDVHLVIEDIPSGATGEARVSFDSADDGGRL